MATFVYKLFDLYTQKYILADPDDPNSVLTEVVENSLLEKILPPEAATKLSLADIEMGMDGEMVEGNHPDPENNVLLLNKGSRGLYGPPEYKQLIEPFLDPTKDYPYHRYLSNDNKSLQTKDLKVWVIDDEEAISGVGEVSSEQARVILGDSHGKVSQKLGETLGDPTRLVQYRMLGVDTPFFSKGTFQAALQSTLDKHELDQIPALQDIDVILPTSSIKGASKPNLPPGVHTVKVHLAAHKEGSERKYTMRSVLEKLEGDPLSYALKEQTQEIESINQTFGNQEKLLGAFVKSLEPAKMPDPDNPGEEIDFDPQRWQECGKASYIVARHDFESGHYQLLESPVYSDYMKQFFASRARKAAELEFVKVKGGMIYCSHDLNNDEICIPDLPEGERVAAIRSPIIKLQDISIARNRHIPDMYNDAGDLMQGAIICSPQAYDRIINSARNFVTEQTKELAAAGVDVSELNSLNAFNLEQYRNLSPISLESNQRQQFIEAMNIWREAYNDLVLSNKVDAPQLQQIRQDTFAAILAADYDGDNIAVVSQSKHPELVAGIEAAIAKNDNITEKLDKIKLEDPKETLGSVLARKADPFILGKTANLAESLQSYAVEATRIQQLGSKQQKLEHLQKIAPVFYYVLGQPTAGERESAEKQKLIPTFRDYIIASTESRAIDSEIVARFDLYNLNRELPNVLAAQDLSEPDLDRALKLWHDLLLNINDKVSQQNQIAVDNFKSERQVDSAFVEGISRRFRYLNDGLKKALDANTTYYSEVPKLNNTTTNRSLLVENINRNLVSFGIDATPYARIEHLFPQVEDLDIQQQVASVVAQYKNFYKLSRVYRDKLSVDSGPSLIFQHQGNKIEISNILSQDHTPESLRKLAESGELEIKLAQNSKSNASHRFVAMYRSGEDWKPLGTLCNACATLNNIKQEMDFGKIAKFDFVTPVGTHQAEAYNQQAKKIAENFRASIPLEQRDTYAAATYSFLVKTGNQSNNLGFMFAAFGEEMIRATQEFNLKSIRLNTLTGAKIPTEKTALLFEPDPTEQRKQAVYVLDGGQTKTKLGLVDHDYFHLRAGARVEASISYTPPSVGVFTLADGQEFTIGGMAKAEASGEIFNDQEIEVELATVEPITTPIFKLDGKVIGSMNERTAAFLQSQGDLVKGKQLQVKLTSEGSGFARKIKAVAPNGDLFEIVNNYKIGHQSTKNRGFTAENAVVTVDFQTSKRQLAAFAIRDGQRVRLGEFNRNHRASQTKVESLGLVGQRFTARLKNNVTTLDLNIDPETIVYPESLSKETNPNQEVVSTEINPTTTAFLDQMLAFEPIMHYRDRVYQDQAGSNTIVNSLDLVIDRQKCDRYLDLLTEIGFQKLADQDPSISLESSKGFAVFTIPARNLSSENFNRLQRDFKTPRVFDERISDTAQTKFTKLLKQRYSDVKLRGVDSATTVELPLLNSVERSSSRFVESNNILHLLAADKPSRELLAKLNRYDYGWLNAKLNPSEIIASPVELENYLSSPNNLAQARELVKGYLTQTEALVYQHLRAGTDLRYQEELVKVAGSRSIEKVKSLIAAGIDPLYIPDGSTPQSIPPLNVNRQAYVVPLPDNIPQGVAIGIVLGNPQNDLSWALGDPQNSEAKDLVRPIEFEGVNYPSVQDALSTLRNQQGFEATRNLPEKLLAAKLVQYPELLTQIDRKGGKRWLYQNSYLHSQNQFMSGTGRSSGLVRATVAAYESASKAIARQQQEANLNQKAPVVSSYLTKQMFVESQTIAPGTVISNWTSGDSLAAALSMATANAKYRKNVEQEYPVSFGGNPERPPNPNLKVEKYFKVKPAGEPFVSAEDAYQHFAVGLDGQQKYQLMVDLLAAKLEQHPELVMGIAQRGGTAWLATCSYRDPNNDRLWGGKGNNSGFIKALSQAYVICRDRTLGVDSSMAKVGVEKHAPETLPKLFAGKLQQGNEVWGMHVEPIGDLVNGRILDFNTGKQIEPNSFFPNLDNSQEEIRLNSGQQKALEGLVEFAVSKNEQQFAVLSGSAGTGKSFTVTRLLQEIKAQKPHLKIGFAAPTHAAVSVLHKMAKEAGVKPDNLKTLAATLGIKPQIDLKTGAETFKIPSGHKFKLPDVLVIDEASMIGSELYQHIQEAAAVTGCRIVMMGDKIQLPPVGELISPVFADDSITSRYDLTEIMRYDGDIIVTADQMRQQVETIQSATSIAELEEINKVDYGIPSSADGQIITGKSSSWEELVIKEFTSSEFKADPNHVKVVAYTNARVKELNQSIRGAIYGTQDVPEFVPGDVMVSLGIYAGLDGNNRDAQLNTSEGFVVDSARKGTDQDTGYKTWEIKGHSLTNVDDSGQKTQIPKIVVVADESKQQYQADLKKLAAQARQDRSWKPYFALRDKYQSVDYGYAITTHRSQGSTFNKVAIDRTNFDLRLGHFNKGSNFSDKKQALQEYYQLMYVALTRAKGGVMIADDVRVRDIVFEDNLPVKNQDVLVSSPDISALPGIQLNTDNVLEAKDILQPTPKATALDLPPEIQQMMEAAPSEPAVSDPSLLYGDDLPDEVESVKPEPKKNTPPDTIRGFISVSGVSAVTTPTEALQESISVEHHNLKQVVSSVFEDFTVQIDSSLRFWLDKSDRDRATDSFIATFNDGSPEAIAYSAAKVGSELHQSRMNYFIESANGSDLMYVLDVPHTDCTSIRDTLEVIGLSSYTLVPQSDSTRIILSDRGAKQPAEVSALAKHYHQQLQTYAGSFQSLTQDRYAATIRAYEASHRDVSSKRSLQANDNRGQLQGDRLGRQPEPPRIGGVAQRVAAIANLNFPPVLTKLAGKATKLIAAGPKLDGLNDVWESNDFNHLSSDDKVLVTGPTIEDLSTAALKQLFVDYYQPRLAQVIAAKAKVFLTNQSGIDRLASKYLAQQGYSLKDSDKGYLQAWSKVKEKEVLGAQDLLHSVIPANTMQQQRVDEAAPIIINLINSTYSKTQFDTNKYSLSYDSASRILTMTDKESGDNLLSATYSLEDRTYITNSTALTLSNTAIGELKDALDRKMSVPNVPQPALVDRFAVKNNSASNRVNSVNAQDFQR